MKITSAEFVISNTDVNKCPQTGFLEYAFISRSNVGKSSLINMLTGSKKLAMTSSTPGKTLLINHFIINKQWYLVDLPGYGYANRSKKSVADIQRVIGSYLEKRMEMTCLFVLIDSRLEPQKIDVNFMNKQSKSRTDSNVKVYLDKLKEQWEELPPFFITSSLSGVGKDEMLSYIDSINNTLN